ncbi:hypothetical protein [Limnofasciculus baicalensis]|uniref:Uncharacterized protein n=1 Tax=Limnofasciculus baicalensis BBK-W-15 TaxID=2699891 RepID=A0AAE3KKP8_9CYAN|nr:hypothetical protein [Limnofasciculus baicalensis]MCP2727755.1 hypothetical protein [Limnofasciculus baicalensis BBK-W-15]
MTWCSKSLSPEINRSFLLLKDYQIKRCERDSERLPNQVVRARLLQITKSKGAIATPPDYQIKGCDREGSFQHRHALTQ